MKPTAYLENSQSPGSECTMHSRPYLLICLIQPEHKRQYASFSSGVLSLFLPLFSKMPTLTSGLLFSTLVPSLVFSPALLY